MTKTATEARSKAPEVEVVEPTDLAVVPDLEDELELAHRAAGKETALVDQLQHLEAYAAIVQRRMELLETIRRAAIRQTRPQDWVLFKDQEGEVTCLLADSGVNIIAEAYGVVISNIRPTGTDGRFAPEEFRNQKGVRGLRAWCDVLSRVNGRSLEALEVSIREDEDFTGRGEDASGAITTRPKDVVTSLDQDLRSALYTRLRSKATRIVCGVTRVPAAEIEAAWTGTTKKLETGRKGHGYGRSTERQASAVTDGDVKLARKKLGDEILRRVGGDVSSAREVLVEITGNPPKFKGFDSVERLTKDWQVENAWKKLREHPVFGDHNKGEPEGEDEPEQGALV